MQDGIIKGTGNSRYLKSVQNFLSLYPTYQDFVSALVDGTLPIDFNGINTDGWNQIGTALNKANLLSDPTASLLGIYGDATPNTAFAKLANRAISGIKVIQGSYTGNDNTGSEDAPTTPRRTISIGETPFLVLLFRGTVQGNIFWAKRASQSLCLSSAGGGYDSIVLSDYGTVDGGFEVGFYDAAYNRSSGAAYWYGSNSYGEIYNYIAFCIAGGF